MGRQCVPKGQVFLKKGEKIAATLNCLDDGHTEDQFVEKFRELYPNDWEKIVKRYEAHEKLTSKGKSHPMAPPKKYLISAYKVERKKSHES
jgi:hypothetical protein